MALIFDLETDGFLEECTKIHCLVVKDTETNEVWRCFERGNKAGFSDIEEGLFELQHYTGIISGHNIIKFDIPVIQKFYPWFHVDESKVLDTLVCSRLIWSNVGDIDATLVSQNKSAVYTDVTTPHEEDDGGTYYNTEKVLVSPEFIKFPTKLWGSQSLQAWGYRLMEYKGDYSGPWDTFSQEMLDYCVQDVEVTHKLHQKIVDKNYSQLALELEHKVAFICAKMERSGWPFDVSGAAALYAELAQKRDSILKTMQETFEPIVEKRVSEKTGKPLKDKVTEFNPSSRKQIADRLISKYGWKPKEFTPNGQPKIDETVLKALDYPEAQTLAEYFLLEKRVGQLAEGDNAWLKLERKGRLHGSINPNGAVTGRCTHQNPNIAQVPAVRRDKNKKILLGLEGGYGHEYRELFTVDLGYDLVGCDLSGLELRCLAHFMSRWDEGAYIETVIHGKQSEGTDIHTVNQRAAGLATRDQAKTFCYAFLYGAGDEKIGSIIGGGSKDGKRIKQQFLDATPSLKKLREAVGHASKRGHLIGLDGRNVHVRSEHAALNTLLQSAGALIAKQWLVEVDKAAEERGWVYGKDWERLGFIHDEQNFQVRSEIANEFGQMVVDSAFKAGEFFNFKCPIGAEYNVGKTWADVH